MSSLGRVLLNRFRKPITIQFALTSKNVVQFVAGGEGDVALTDDTVSPDRDRRATPDPADARPTLKTIARMTGLAVATVSRALSDAPDIGADTKIRVRKAAQAVGYRPNRAGVRLRTGKTKVIALAHATDHDFVNHVARLTSAIARELRDTGYHLIITPFFPDEDPMTPVRYIVETGAADGVILNETQPVDPRVDYLLSHGVAVATHGRTATPGRHPSFDFDNAAFARLAVERIASRGRRRLLLVLPPGQMSYARHTRTGALAAGDAHGVAVEILDTATSHDRALAIEAALADRLGQGDLPDAILCASTAAGMAAVAAAEARGLVIGRDLDIVGKEALPFLSRLRRELLVVPEDVGRAGRFLARALVAAIQDPKAPPLEGLDVPTAFVGDPP
jgi:LacI family transcriptional regulator